MHQQQLLGQPANESALVDEVPLIITARKVEASLPPGQIVHDLADQSIYICIAIPHP